MRVSSRIRLAAALLGAFALGHAALAPAAPAVVEGVQMPAWLERGGSTAPLAAGTELRAGDRVRTGAGSRLLLKLEEGSLVKLGENGALRIAELPAKRGGIFRAALNVAEGAFRFTTDVIAKQRRRDVSITVATVTAGIRGTDLWGKSESGDKQIVCLIEGKIEVGAQGEAPVTMDRPLQFYQRERGQTAPVSFVSQQQLDVWARETEIEGGKGASRRGGRFAVNLIDADTQAAALAVYDQVRTAGYAARIQPRAGEKQSFRVRITNLPSRAEAEALAAQLKGKFGVSEPTVSG